MKRYIEASFLVAVMVFLLNIPQPHEVEKITVKESAFIPPTVVDFATVETPETFAPYSFLSLDDDLQVHMETLCADMDLDFFLCASLMFSESSFKADAVSKDGKDIGLFQIRASVWEDYFNEMGLDIYDPKDNIECGLLILKKLCDKYPAETALQCYKCGESRGLQLIEEGIVLSSIETIIERQKEWEKK